MAKRLGKTEFWTALIVAAIAATATLIAQIMDNSRAISLEERKADAALLRSLLADATVKEAKERLEFATQVGLFSDQSIEENLSAFLVDENDQFADWLASFRGTIPDDLLQPCVFAPVDSTFGEISIAQMELAICSVRKLRGIQRHLGYDVPPESEFSDQHFEEFKTYTRALMQSATE